MKYVVLLLSLLFFGIPESSAQVYHQVTHTAGTQNVAGNDITVTSMNVMTPVDRCGIGPYLIGCATHLACPGNAASYTFDFAQPVNIVRLRFVAMSYVGTISFEINGAPFYLENHHLSYPNIACNPATQNNVSTQNGNLYMPTNTGNGSTQVDLFLTVPIRTLKVTQAHQYQNNATFDLAFSFEKCQGQTIELTAPTYAGATYNWTGPGGYSAGTQNISLPNAPTTASGTYTVNVTQGAGVVFNRSYNILVNPKPSTPVITSNSPLCSGQTLQLGANAQGALGYIWSGPNRFASNSQNPSVPNVRTANAGVYEVYAKSDKGCNSDTARENVIVDVPPVVDFSFDIDYGCGYDTVRFTNNTSGATSYFWDFGDGTTDTVENPVHIYRTRGSFSYYVKLVASSGCRIDSIVTVLTLNNPLRADFLISEDTICQGQSVSFENKSTISSGAPLSYYWDFKDGNSSTIEHPTNVFNEPGTYHIMLVASDTIPCHDTAYQDLWVEPFQVKILGDTLCPRDMQLGFELIAPGHYGGFTYEWTPAGAFDDNTLAEPVLFAREEGIFVVTLTVNSSFPKLCTASDTATLVIATPQALTNVTPDTLIPYKGMVQLYADGAVYYSWAPTEKLDNAHIQNPKAILEETTTFAVYGIDKYGCWDTAYVKVYVDPPADVFIPTAFTPDGDGTNDVFRVVNRLNRKISEFRVFNRAGQELFYSTTGNAGWDGTYKGEPQPGGVYYYILRIAYPDGTEKVHKGDITLIR